MITTAHASPRRLPPAATLVLTLVTLALAPHAARSQTFQRVTDPANPVVTDAFESGGAYWLDLVGDGQLDLFVAHGNVSIQHSALYRNTRDGGFVRVVTGAVASDSGSGIGCTAADFDNDGHQDLFVTDRNNHGNFLYRGLGDTLFDKVTTGGPSNDVQDSNSSSWVDLDNDGNLDLYVVNFSQHDFAYLNNGGPGFTFTRVDTLAPVLGLELSIPGAWGDYNDDGRDDLFIGTGGAQSDLLYTNHGGLFFTRSAFSDARSSLGASWGDYDNDGYLDLFVTGYLNKRSILYHNSGPPAFTLTPVTTAAPGIDAGNWVGSGWGDYDNDGNLDLIMAGDGGPSELFHNDGPPAYTFTKVTTGPLATDAGNAFGCVWGDYDRDGNLDLLICHRANQADYLYRNLGGTSNHWLTLRCQGTASNRSAVGAKVRVWATIGGVSRAQLREVTSQTGYNSGNLDQHFGLGDATVADSVVVRWPSGQVDTWRAMPADSLRLLVEGASLLGVGGAAREPGRLALALSSPNPGAGRARVRYELPHAGRARLDVFDVAGRCLATPFDRWCGAGSQSADVDVPAGHGLVFLRLTQDGRSAVTRSVRLR